MQIVKWPIPIISKLADNRPIIGAPLLQTVYHCPLLQYADNSGKQSNWAVSVVSVLLRPARQLGIHCLPAFVTQSWVSTLSNVN